MIPATTVNMIIAGLTATLFGIWQKDLLAGVFLFGLLVLLTN